MPPDVKVSDENYSRIHEKFDFENTIKSIEIVVTSNCGTHIK
jgi:hypothetical protein